MFPNDIFVATVWHWQAWKCCGRPGWCQFWHTSYVNKMKERATETVLKQIVDIVYQAQLLVCTSVTSAHVSRMSMECQQEPICRSKALSIVGITIRRNYYSRFQNILSFLMSKYRRELSCPRWNLILTMSRSWILYSAYNALRALRTLQQDNQVVVHLVTTALNIL